MFDDTITLDYSETDEGNRVLIEFLKRKINDSKRRNFNETRLITIGITFVFAIFAHFKRIIYTVDFFNNGPSPQRKSLYNRKNCFKFLRFRCLEIDYNLSMLLVM